MTGKLSRTLFAACATGLSAGAMAQVREHYDSDPKRDRGFLIDGKSAADVFRRWSEKCRF